MSGVPSELIFTMARWKGPFGIPSARTSSTTILRSPVSGSSPDDGLETPLDDHNVAISIYRHICRVLELWSFAYATSRHQGTNGAVTGSCP